MLYNCNLCNKEYKSYQSLWNHNKIKHVNLCLKISNKECKFSCEQCNKKFTRNDNLKYHINNTCKIKNDNINNFNDLKDKIQRAKLKIFDF